MKKLFFILSLILLFSVNILAADSNPTGGMDYTGGGGFDFGYLMMIDFNEFGNAIENAGYSPLSNGITYYGWSSIFGFRDGIQWGVSSFQGQAKNSDANTEAMSNLKLNSWGLIIDYGKSIDDNTSVSGGLSLGGTSLELTLKEKKLTDIAVPNKIHLTNYLFTLGPRISGEYRVSEWLALRGTIGYLYGIGKDSWKDEKERTNVVPALMVNGPVFGVSAQIAY